MNHDNRIIIPPGHYEAADTGPSLEITLLLAERKQLRADNAALRALLAEAAERCEVCGDLATRFNDDGAPYDTRYRCEKHAPDDWRLADLSRRIKAALEEKP
jgi:hypothetical protein